MTAATLFALTLFYNGGLVLVGYQPTHEACVQAGKRSTRHWSGKSDGSVGDTTFTCTPVAWPVGGFPIVRGGGE